MDPANEELPLQQYTVRFCQPVMVLIDAVSIAEAARQAEKRCERMPKGTFLAEIRHVPPPVAA